MGIDIKTATAEEINSINLDEMGVEERSKLQTEVSKELSSLQTDAEFNSETSEEIKAKMGALSELKKQLDTDKQDKPESQGDVFGKEDRQAARDYLTTIKDKSRWDLQQYGRKWISAVQVLLSEKGLFNWKIDWYLGPITKKAVREFQDSVGIHRDGGPGPETMNKLLGTILATPVGEGEKEKEDEQAGNEADKNEKNGPLKGLEEWVDYIEETANLIEKYGKRFILTRNNQKDYIGVLNSIMSSSNKKWGLKSLLALKDEFWGSYKIDLDWLKILEEKLDSSDLDWTDDTFEIVDDKDEYVTIKWGKLVKAENDGWHHEPVFEANGTSSVDDYRFDSVEAFMKFMSWEEIISESKYVEEVAKSWEITELEAYKNRFTDDLWNRTAELKSLTWDKYKTFLSLLTLSDKFWSGYKLTLKDFKNFIKWMEEDVFDYSSGSSTVFHAEWSKFEVDWTGYLSDDTFGSVSEFFDYLEKKV